MPYNVVPERGRKAPVITALDTATIVEAREFVFEHFKEFFAVALVKTEALKVQLPGGIAFRRMIAEDVRGRRQSG
jgi:hypothetical protein